jgi:hypothetical protein
MALSPRLSLVALLALSACDCDCDDPPPPAPRPVSILVEVYDPATNFVWENVAVRVVEADQEWSNCTCVSPRADYYLTDQNGQVLIDELLLARAEVGFRLDSTGIAALIWPGSYEDEATVVIEVSAEGFTPVFVEVPLSWATPDMFVEVPFN